MTIDSPHTGGFASSPFAPDLQSSIRIILVGIMGPPERWRPIYSALEEVCRPMIFPFSKDEPDKDRTVAANVVEYADVAGDLKGNVISGDPTIVFCLPGIDRNRRIGILAEMLPGVLSHHEVHGSLLYCKQDEDALFEGILEAKSRGFDTCNLGPIEELTKEDVQKWAAEWLVRLDPSTQ